MDLLRDCSNRGKTWILLAFLITVLEKIKQTPTNMQSKFDCEISKQGKVFWLAAGFGFSPARRGTHGEFQFQQPESLKACGAVSSLQPGLLFPACGERE